jgi:heterogeneous nuclear ribonucleoprotein A1/A3
MSEYKIFVGNVPFECNTCEFKKCFENVYGYLNAEIVTKYNTDGSRGFGFVTLNNQETVNMLLNNTSINFKDRILRFAEYESNNKKNNFHIYVNTPQENRIFDNIDTLTINNNIKIISSKNLSTDKLREIFKIYKTKICFMFVNRNNGDETNVGIIQFVDNSDYINVLNTGKMSYDDYEFTFEKTQ